PLPRVTLERPYGLQECLHAPLFLLRRIHFVVLFEEDLARLDLAALQLLGHGHDVVERERHREDLVGDLHLAGLDLLGDGHLFLDLGVRQVTAFLTEVDQLADLLRILLAVTARRRRRGFRLRLRLGRRLRLSRRLRLGRRRSSYAAGGRLFRHQTLSALPKGPNTKRITRVAAAIYGKSSESV